MPPIPARTKNGGSLRAGKALATAPRQLDLVLDDVRLQGMTQGEAPGAWL